MTDKELEQVKRMWAQGQSAVQISRVLPYKEYLTLQEIGRLKKGGVLPPRNVQELRASAVIAEFAENRNLQEIADKLGLSLGYVRNILTRKGIKHPKTIEFVERQKSDKTLQIIDELAQGKTLGQISKKHGVSRQYVSQVKKRINNE